MKKLANAMNEESLNSGDVLEIFLPAHDSCMWLNQDVVIIDRYAYLFLIFKYRNLHIYIIAEQEARQPNLVASSLVCLNQPVAYPVHYLRLFQSWIAPFGLVNFLWKGLLSQHMVHLGFASFCSHFVAIAS